MKKARTELATKSLPDNQIMTWECASWHACSDQDKSSQASNRRTISSLRAVRLY